MKFSVSVRGSRPLTARTVATDPRQIVQELDRYIVGQDAAKRAVAVAIRNRWRRQQLPPELRKDVTPKNIIMIGPTGVGKTEIARRLAQLVGAPFLKVEATKYTEVGYIGRDVESMIRDLTEIAIGMVQQEQRGRSRPRPRNASTNGCSTCCCPRSSSWDGGRTPRRTNAQQRTRDKMQRPPGSRRAGRPHGRAERRADGPCRCRSSPTSAWSRWTSISRACSSRSCPSRTSSGSCRSREARRVLLEQETEALIDRQVVTEKAVELAENQGIIFIDELDKICGPPSSARPRRVAPGRAARPACRWSRARRSTPATARCGPTTSCSSRPGRFTCPSRPT